MTDFYDSDSDPLPDDSGDDSHTNCTQFYDSDSDPLSDPHNCSPTTCNGLANSGLQSQSDEHVCRVDTPVSKNPVIMKLRKLLGLKKKKDGAPRIQPSDPKKALALAKKRDNRYKVEIVNAINSKVPLLEEDILELLSWRQAKEVWPNLHRYVKESTVFQKLSTLENNIRGFFSKIGKSAAKAATALLSRSLDRKYAAKLTGKKRKYIDQALAASYDPSLSRLCSEQYAPNTKRRRVLEIEEEATRADLKPHLQEKSAQKDDTWYRNKSLSHLYFEDYVPNFHSVCRRMKRKLDSLSSSKADEMNTNKRFRRNMQIWNNCGERADIWLPSVTDGSESSDSDLDEKDQSSSSSTYPHSMVVEIWIFCVGAF